MSESTTEEQSAIREIILDGWRLPVFGTGEIPFSDLARFQPKVLFGDPGKDDNDLLSAWQMGNFTGGTGVLDMMEGTDEGRYWMGTLHTRYPGQITKPPYFNAVSSTGTGNKMVLGEFWGSPDNTFMVVYSAGLEVRRATVVAGTNGSLLSETAGNLTTLPYNKGCSFQGTHTEERFFIPQGNAGYAHITGSSASPTEIAAPKFSFLTVWDNKLIGITTGGRMYWSLDGTTFTGYDLTYQLSKSYRIRNMLVYFDRRDEPAIFIVTDRDLWQFDPNGPELFRIDNGWPSHPYHGQAAAVWNGQLFVSVGMAVFRYSGGSWMPMGLDRDNGLPAEYHGYIVDMVSGHNSLYALVQGVNGDDTYGSKSSLHEYTGFGWHCIWNDDNAIPDENERSTHNTTALTVTGVMITQSSTEQTLLLSTAGTDDTIYSSPLPLTFANPRSAVSSGQVFGTGDYYYLETPEFDANMFGYIKIANAIQFYLEEPIVVPDDDRDIFRILYRVDRGLWRELIAMRADPGRYAIPFGKPDARDIYPGEQFERIQLRYIFQRPAGATLHADRPAILTNAVLSFLKTVNSNHSWQVSIEVTPEGYADRNGKEILDFLDSMIERRKFVELVIANRSWRVLLTQNGGTMRGGLSGEQGKETRDIALVHVEIPFG